MSSKLYISQFILSWLRTLEGVEIQEMGGGWIS
jgi:hypothetical protein